MEHARLPGRPRLREPRQKIWARCTPEQKNDLHLVAGARNVSIGQLLDEHAPVFAAQRAEEIAAATPS